MNNTIINAISSLSEEYFQKVAGLIDIKDLETVRNKIVRIVIDNLIKISEVKDIKNNWESLFSDISDEGALLGQVNINIGDKSKYYPGTPIPIFIYLVYSKESFHASVGLRDHGDPKSYKIREKDRARRIEMFRQFTKREVKDKPLDKTGCIMTFNLRAYIDEINNLKQYFNGTEFLAKMIKQILTKKVASTTHHELVHVKDMMTNGRAPYEIDYTNPALMNPDFDPLDIDDDAEFLMEKSDYEKMEEYLMDGNPITDKILQNIYNESNHKKVGTPYWQWRKQMIILLKGLYANNSMRDMANKTYFSSDTELQAFCNQIVKQIVDAGYKGNSDINPYLAKSRWSGIAPYIDDKTRNKYLKYIYLGITKALEEKAAKKAKQK